MQRTAISAILVTMILLTGEVRSAHAECEQHGADCRACQKGFEKEPPSRDREGPGPGPSDRGAYVAPPRSGIEFGESRGFGVEGPALHFPALTLRMPVLLMPCVTRVRRGSHMVIEEAKAPYTEDVGRAEFSREAPAPPPQDRGFPPSEPRDFGKPGARDYPPQYDGPYQRGTPSLQKDYSHNTGSGGQGSVSATDESISQRQQLEQRIRHLETVIAILESRGHEPQLGSDDSRLSVLRSDGVSSRNALRPEGISAVILPSSVQVGYLQVPPEDGQCRRLPLEETRDAKPLPPIRLRLEP
jgi:hypothetical protein